METISKTQEIRKAIEESTAGGNWKFTGDNDGLFEVRAADGSGKAVTGWGQVRQLPQDAVLIANAPHWLLWQNEEIERLRAELIEANRKGDRLSKQLKASRDSVYPISVEADEARCERTESQEKLKEAIEALEHAHGRARYIATIGEREWRMDDPLDLARQLSEDIAEALCSIAEKEEEAVNEN